ncbi:LamB/YcsF family protein [Vibrio ichthyoenteri ATCC 700023]|uniref:5-oxoprolinase subunit A n=1 Tax=Vibrio ichthyoenteri ATCC 700023 TaxID=870968 RepID=F9S682_9VIBR|nr:5-oxoprolinase subunit PxpA [Vibrio ichthyoenteri]EGU33920.1 LamB/YcsF family protein [Vibrio ichthyoenteri ATCC 700023]
MSKQQITLNCDMGESYGQWKMGCDEDVMPLIDMANIACGFHASDPKTMAETVQLAVQHNIKIGAHPSYPDMVGFGRRSLAMQADELTYSVIYQVGALKALCESFNTELCYIKPHGALYNDMLQDHQIFEAVVDAVSCFNVPLMMLAVSNTQPFLDIADRYEVPLLFEAFADRAYLSDGSLAPRNQIGAVLQDSESVINQVKQLTQFGKIRTLDGDTLTLEADTICVHGDNPHAVEILTQLNHALGLER